MIKHAALRVIVMVDGIKIGAVIDDNRLLPKCMKKPALQLVIFLESKHIVLLCEPFHRRHDPVLQNIFSMHPEDFGAIRKEAVLLLFSSKEHDIADLSLAPQFGSKASLLDIVATKIDFLREALDNQNPHLLLSSFLFISSQLINITMFKSA